MARPNFVLITADDMNLMDHLADTIGKRVDE